MKKTFNINLAGYPFIIDDDAFNLLEDYLETIRAAFSSKEDGAEIVSDIEFRIAELLMESDPQNNRIVTIGEVSNVIRRIGQPDEIFEDDETVNINTDSEKVKVTDTESERITPPPYDPYGNNYRFGNRKKLFRDPQNAMLGGVCSGLAYYMNLDPTIVRLITVILFFLSATAVGIAYIILWIVVPEAHTPIQKMEMMGEEPTVINIGKKVTDYFRNFNNSSNVTENSENKGVGNSIAKFFAVIVKIFIVIGLIIAIPVLIILVSGLLSAIFVLLVSGASIIGNTEAMGKFGRILPDWLSQTEFIPLYLVLFLIGAIITIGIPFFLFVRMAFKKKESNLSPAGRRALLVVWLCGIALTVVFCVKTIRTMERIDHSRLLIQLEELEDVEELEITNESVENLEINKEGIKITKEGGKTIIVNENGITVEKPNDKKIQAISSDSISVRVSNPVDSVSITIIKDTIQ